MRIVLAVEYDGSDFHGWQRQHNARTVQESLEIALSQVANHAVRVQCAGRTDAGVHALEQIVHFDTDAQRSLRSWVLGGNANLPPDVSLLWAGQVTDDFHARFSATGRCYRYVILNRFTRPAILRQRSVWIHHPLDVERMQQAGHTLIGTHDFSSFRAQDCQAKTPIRTVEQLQVSRKDDQVIIEICANAFLQHMVRNIAGVLISIGRQEQPVDWAAEVLARRNRAEGGVTAPPQGLFLVSVRYPNAQFNLAKSRLQSH